MNKTQITQKGENKMGKHNNQNNRNNNQMKDWFE